ncbi:MAG: hypothetical protein CL678_13175 [Bdellovibrionaceae bacterium]|nr:hypothetical protein [Pseudobdellovibrionaceae bacterium]|tara:strand:- start:3517 stop:4023 length:507 start_codon:yes stop_codon:yes gene_type:complete
MKKLKFTLVIVSLITLGGCGGDNPLDLLGSPENIPTTLTLPFSSGFFGTATVSSAYTSSSPFVTFLVPTGANIIAPTDGVITSISGAIGNISISMLHGGGRLSSTVGGIYSSQVRVGSSVVKNQVIGAISGTTAITLSLALDGVSVCPISFLDNTSKQAASAYTFMCL